jgi:hypothetical protein
MKKVAEKSQPDRFSDTGEQLLDFMDEYDVVCPRCKKLAHVAIVDATAPPLFAPRRLTCLSCGHVAEWLGSGVRSWFSDEPRDWYFKRPFFYRIACCGHVLWVFNRRHLQFLKEFVSAKIRSRSKGKRGWSNRSLASRLPKWISTARHREDILVSLAKLERHMDSKK